MFFRYNDFTSDPLSRCNCTPPYSAENAISARSDLNPANGVYPFSALGHRSHGGVDMKVNQVKCHLLRIVFLFSFISVFFNYLKIYHQYSSCCSAIIFNYTKICHHITNCWYVVMFNYMKIYHLAAFMQLCLIN